VTEPALDFKQIWQLFQETDRKFQEMQRAWDRKFQEADKKIKVLQDLFEGQWGKLMESLVEGDLVRLLRRQNVQI